MDVAQCGPYNNNNNIRQLIRRRNTSMKSLQRRRTAYATRIKLIKVILILSFDTIRRTTLANSSFTLFATVKEWW